MQELIPDESEDTYNIRMRHQIIIERTIARFKRFDSEEKKAEKINYVVLNTIDKSAKLAMDADKSLHEAENANESQEN